MVTSVDCHTTALVAMFVHLPPPQASFHPYCPTPSLPLSDLGVVGPAPF
jgi:hypothetical protein